jgi:predicted MFS family arabinose efflux permease
MPAAKSQRHFAFTLLGIGAASTAAHLGNNFTTYLIGGLMDRFGFSPTAMGAWNMTETLSYAAAMFLVAPRARAMDARVMAVLATVLVATAQASSALMTSFPLLLLGRIGTGLGFGIMNSAVNLAAGRTAHPARSISLGIAFQTIMFAAINIGLPIVGKDYGVAGMFTALAALTGILGFLALALPGGTGLDGDAAAAPSNAPIGAEGRRVLAAMACALLTTVSTEPAFAAALIAFNVSWFLTYPLLLGLAYSIDDSGRLAVMTTATWLLSQSIGSLAAGGIAQNFGGYTLIGPMGAMVCLAAVAVALPTAKRLDQRLP